MEQTIDTLKEAVSRSYDMHLSDTPQLNRSEDVFQGESDTSLVIRKDVARVGGEVKMIRRAFLRLNHSDDYRNVGWVLDEDLEGCMSCGAPFGLFQRRTHCRVCGDLLCRPCCSSEVLLKEFKDWGYVPACDFCFYGQEEVSVKFPQTTHIMHQKIQQIHSSNDLEMAKAKAEAERIIEVAAKLEAEKKAKAEEEAAMRRVMAEREAAEEAARVRAEEEAVASDKATKEAALRQRAEKEAAAKIKEAQEAAAKHLADQEAERVRAEREAAAKIKAAEDEAAKAKTKQEAAAKLKAAEEEAARIKAEKEAALQRAAAEAAAKVKAEEEAAERVRADQEAARIRAEVEARRIKVEQYAQAKLKAEEDAARLIAEEEEAKRKAAEEAAAAKIKAVREATERLKAAEKALVVRAEVESAEFKTEEATKSVKEANGTSLTSENSRDNKVTDSSPFSVVKLRDGSGNKIFVNVCTSDKLQLQKGAAFVLGEGGPRRAVDKKGDSSMTFDVCVPSDFVSSSSTENNVYVDVINHLKTLTGEEIPNDFSLPKVKGKFKGEHIPEFNCDTKGVVFLGNTKGTSDMENSDLFHEDIEEKEEFSGQPFAVVKTRDFTNNSKVFINVCVGSLESHYMVIGEGCPRLIDDKNGSTSTTYDVCVNGKMLESPEDQKKVFPDIIELLIDKKECDLSDDYTLPKVKSMFKGDHVPLFRLENKIHLAGGEVFDGSKVPEKFCGTVKRQEGALIKSFKQRFLLVQNGVMLVYKSEADYANRQPEIDMIALTATFSATKVNAKGKQLPDKTLCLLDTEDPKFEVILQLDSSEKFETWKHHVKQHLSYVAYKAAHLLS